MNAIRATQKLTQKEIEDCTPPSASWHRDYQDTAWVYIGGLPFHLSEGDVVTIFSQYGEPVHINLIRDKETGKSLGFAFLKYEDQRSTDLAVDNLSGTEIDKRMLNVEHARYKLKEDEVPDNLLVGTNAGPGHEVEEEREMEERPLLKEEKELQALLRDHDEEDPMKEYLVREKREEVEKALERLKVKGEKKSRRGHHREDGHRPERRHRIKGGEDRGSERRHHHRSERSHRRSTSRDRDGGRDSDRREHRRASRDRSYERRHPRERSHRERSPR